MFSRSAGLPGFPQVRRTAVYAAALALLTAAPAWAQSPAPAASLPAHAAAARSYDIAPGPLSPALSRFAGQSGITLSADPALTAGLQTTGLRGSFGVLDGFAQLLQGTGLAAAQAGDKTFVLRRLSAAQAQSAAASAATLAEIKVAAQAERIDTTEGTGSYAAQAASVGSKTATSLREVPQSVSVVTRQQIEDANLTTIYEVMKATPGIAMFQGSMLASRYLSRGFETTNVRVDGGAANNQLNYTTDADMTFYDHVEVLRGADGLFGGAGEPGGTINLVRKRPTKERQVVAQAQAGSWNFKRADIDVGGALNEDGSVRARGVLAQENKNYFYDVASSKRTLAYGVLEADLTRDTNVLLGLSYNHRDSSFQGYGLPRASTGESLGLPRSFYLSGADDRANRTAYNLFGHLKHRLDDNWSVDLDVNYERARQQRYDHYFNGIVDVATGSGVSSAPGNQLERWDNVGLDLSVKGRLNFAGRQHDLVVGASYKRVRQNATGYEDGQYSVVDNIFAFDPYAYRRPALLQKVSSYHYPVQEQGLYGALRLSVTDPLHVIVGGRLGFYKYLYQTTDFDTSGAVASTSATQYQDKNVFTPYVAATYALNATWTAYGSMAETYKSQASYVSGPRPGAPLDPVTGRNYELGLKGTHLGGQVQSAFAVYNIERKGAAVRDTRYPRSSGTLGSSCCYLGTGHIISKGFDAEVSGEVLRGLQLSASYNYNENRDKNATDGRYQALTPKHMAKLFATYRLPGDFGRFKIGGGATIQSTTYVSGEAYARNADGSVGTVAVPYKFTQGGYALWSAMAEYRINEVWTASLNIDNLFDKTYYSTVGSIDYGNFYGTPRNVMLTLRGKF